MGKPFMIAVIFYPLFWSIFASSLSKYGDKRQIGGKWTLFFSFFFSPLWGWLIASSSKLNTEPPQKINRPFWYFKMAVSIIIAIASLLGVVRVYHTPSLQTNVLGIAFIVCMFIGFAGASFYAYSKLRQTNNRS